MALERLTNPSVARIVGSTDQVDVSTSGVDKSVVTLSLPQMIGTGSSPQFLDLSITGNANVSTLNSGAINSNSSITVYDSLNGGNTVINSNGTITLINTMSGIEMYVYSNGTIKTSNTSVKKQATINANGYVTFRTAISGGNSYVDLDSNGYISVANGNSFSNTKVDTFSNGFLSVSNSSMMSNTKVDIASNAYVLVTNTTANTKVELFGNGQANVGSLYVNTVQINPSNPWTNSVLIYNGTSFSPGNAPSTGPTVITATLNTSSLTLIDTFSTSSYRGASYKIVITRANSEAIYTQADIIHISGNVGISEYGLVSIATGGFSYALSTNISGGNVNLYASVQFASGAFPASVKMTRTEIAL